MSRPSTPAAAAAEIQRQYQSAREMSRQNALRKIHQQGAAPIIQQNQKQKEKETRKQLQRDRATVQAEARKVNNPNLNEAERTKAVATLSKTVLKGTGLGTTGDSGTMLGNLTADLCANAGTVVALGVKDTIKLKVSAADAATIPDQVVERLKKLV
jgi:hypothetical protein